MVNWESCWSTLLQAFNLLTLSPIHRFQGESALQVPIGGDPISPGVAEYPIFEPPNAPERREFICEYPELPDYEFCSKHSDRGCWLRPKDAGSKKPTYNISTNYDDENLHLKGVTRKYTLHITNETIYPDGCKNSEAKLFNASYPGPWIEACWGDDIEVTVHNHLPCNGTSIHWHGLRQLNNVENDGVNAVTQCPIAPGHSHTYKFQARQYGTSWYHSHYSLQYGDGLAGPLTIHGPSSSNYDTAKDPILMTDWNQRSAFEDFSWSLNKAARFPLPKMTSILLDGKGRAPPGSCENQQQPKLHTMSFQKGVRYLLRLINTSVDTTFIFSIDSHKLTVVEADFVPIKNYTTESVLIGIGQRYHVIVEAKPEVTEAKGNYWIRTLPADGCSVFKYPYNLANATTGIVRYDDSSEEEPTSAPWIFPTACSDEPYKKLVPVVNWTVPDTRISDELEVSLVPANTTPYYPQYPNEDGFRRWSLFKGPLWLNFSDPTILNTAASSHTFLSELSVNTSISSKDQWLELLITGPNDTGSFAAHPIHLHGHDFALLAQGNTSFDPNTAVIKRDNPPRRDVALLPQNGYLLIAFKLDNPGVWLMHCHIAWHASSGLAMQIMENVDRMKIQDEKTMFDMCLAWDDWYGGERLQNPTCNRWDQTHFQDDSGI